MRKRLGLLDSFALAAGISAALAGSSLLAAPGLRRVEDRGRLIAPVESMSLRPASAAERRRALALRESLRSGDGGGGTVADLKVWQETYVVSECPGDCEGNPCNGVILAWDEDPPAEAAVEVAVDDQVVGEVAAGQQVAYLSGIGAGLRTFRVRSGSDGASIEATLAVLDSQPFGDARNLVCSEGAMDGEGTCAIDVVFEHPAVHPDRYAVYVNDDFVGWIPGDIEPPEFTLDEAPAGLYEVILFGASGARFEYLGCALGTECTVTCRSGECQAPEQLLLCQISYGEGLQGVLASWRNPDSGYTAIRAFTDGNFAGDYPGGTHLQRFELATPQARVGVQGTCDGGSMSIVAERVLPLLARTPHPNPVTGSPTCVYAPEFGVTLLNWENADPSDFIIVHVQTPTGSHILGLYGGNQTSVIVPGTGPEDVIHLQFLVLQGEGCYGSDLVSCIPSVLSSYPAPVCNGSAVLDISSPIHLLEALFTRGARLACRPACDCNGDEGIDIADAICMLEFLFQGTAAPLGWYPGCRSMPVPPRCPVPECDG